MPKNWEARERKVEGRKSRMPKHNYDGVQTLARAIVKRGTQPAIKSRKGV